MVALIGAFSSELREQFFSSYLFSYLFILGIALGSMVVVMMHHMTGGGWGYCIRRIAEASAMTMPLLAVLFIPIALNTHYLYPWANPDVVKGDKILEFQGRVWMNQQMWCIRAIIYFAIWIIMALAMWSWAGKHERTGDPWVVLRLKRLTRHRHAHLRHHHELCRCRLDHGAPRHTGIRRSSAWWSASARRSRQLFFASSCCGLPQRVNRFAATQPRRGSTTLETSS